MSSAPPRSLASTAALLAIALVTVVVTAAVHQVRTGARAVAASDDAAAHGDTPAAIDAAYDAAAAVVPGSPYPEQGYLRLSTIARAAEARGDDETATAAWRAVRAAALATRGLFGPSAHFGEANEALARLAWERRTGAAKTGDAAVFRRAVVEPLGRDETPRAATFLLLSLGGLAFAVGTARLVQLPAGTARRTRVAWAACAGLGALASALACWPV